MNRSIPVKEHALRVFRQPPERLNCAQAVIHAWCEVSGATSITPARLKAFGGGRAPGGLCGALHAACLAAPDEAEAMKSAFAARLGSLYCKDLRATGDHHCAACVADAAELLELQTRPRRTKPSIQA
jgi:hypothetical protein